MSGLTTEQADLAFAKTSSYDELAEDVGRCGEEGLTLRPQVGYLDEAVWVNQQRQLEQGDPPSKRGSRQCAHIFWHLLECLKGPLLLNSGPPDANTVFCSEVRSPALRVHPQAFLPRGAPGSRSFSSTFLCTTPLGFHLTSLCSKLIEHTVKSSLDFDLTPAKFCVSLRKLLNHSVHQIGEIMIALNLRVVAGIEEMIPVKNLVCVP